MESTIKIKVMALMAGALLFASSCGESIPVQEHEDAMLDLSVKEQEYRDSMEFVYLSMINDVETNLTKIRDKYGDMILSPLPQGDLKVSKREKILDDIAVISALLDENKAHISRLEKKLNKSISLRKEIADALAGTKEKMIQQEKQLAEFQSIIAERDQKIAMLDNELINKTVQVELLDDVIKENNRVQNKTYFAVGTSKELKAKNIVKSKGGVLGIKKVDVLNEGVKTEDFLELDKSQITTIHIQGDNPKLITQHPIGSYELKEDENQVATLMIRDPEDFWKLSKYLVVEIK